MYLLIAAAGKLGLVLMHVNNINEKFYDVGVHLSQHHQIGVQCKQLCHLTCPVYVYMHTGMQIITDW